MPEVLFLDEPFAALDAPTREALLDDLGRLLGATRTTTVLVTHDRAEALRLGDRVAVLLEGRLAELGLPERVFGAPGSEAVARFVGVENLLPGRVVAHADGLIEVEVGPVRVTVAGEARPGERVLVGLRPEDLTLAPPEAARADERPEPSGRPHRPRHAARAPLAGGRRLRGAAHRARDASGRPDARARPGVAGRGDVQGDGRPSRPAGRGSPGVTVRARRDRRRTGPGRARLDTAWSRLLQGG